MAELILSPHDFYRYNALAGRKDDVTKDSKYGQYSPYITTSVAGK